MRFSNCKTIQELTLSWQEAIKNHASDISEINRDYTVKKQELLNSNKSTLYNIEHLVPTTINVILKIGETNQAVLENDTLKIIVPFTVQEFEATDKDGENTFTFKTSPYPSFSIK